MSTSIFDFKIRPAGVASTELNSKGFNPPSLGFGVVAMLLRLRLRLRFHVTDRFWLPEPESEPEAELVRSPEPEMELEPEQHCHDSKTMPQPIEQGGILDFSKFIRGH